MRKIIDRWLELLQRKFHSHSYAFQHKEVLDDQQCDSLQAIVESPGWEVAMTVLQNINYDRNRAAIGFCDGRSFVEFKKMEGAQDYVDTIQEIVKLHKAKTAPVQQERERPRTIAEYVP